MEQKNKWYIIQVLPNKELTVKENLENRVFEEENTGIEQIYLPFSFKKNKNGTIAKKPMFPGYLFIKVLMTDKSWYIIRNTQYVTGLVGSSGQRTKPTPIPESQINTIIERVKKQEIEQLTGNTSKLVHKIDFKVGDVVQILNGNFKNQFGKVNEISIEKQVAIVEIEFFGRVTPVSIILSDLKLK